jgi:hypothetical protein
MPPPPNQPNSFWAPSAARPRPLIRRINKVAFTHSRLSHWHGAKTIGQTYWRYLRIHPFVSPALDTKVFPILSSDCRCVAPLLSLPGETRRRPDARMVGEVQRIPNRLIRRNPSIAEPACPYAQYRRLLPWRICRRNGSTMHKSMRITVRINDCQVVLCE